ncbi:MAG: hypothetical protein RIS20_1939 [Bacteroidota bacterium]|jgi:hypothetical protein
MKLFLMGYLILSTLQAKAQTASVFDRYSMHLPSNQPSIGKIDVPYFAILPKFKYEFGNVSSVNLGLSWIDFGGDEVVQAPVWYYHGPFVETGVSFKDKRNYMVNKLGYEGFFLIFGGRMNVIHQTDFSAHQFSLRPEFGLSLFSFLTFTYGYNINLNQSVLGLTNGHVFSLNVAYFITKDE